MTPVDNVSFIVCNNCLKLRNVYTRGYDRVAHLRKASTHVQIVDSGTMFQQLIARIFSYLNMFIYMISIVQPTSGLYRIGGKIEGILSFTGRPYECNQLYVKTI